MRHRSKFLASAARAPVDDERESVATQALSALGDAPPDATELHVLHRWLFAGIHFAERPHLVAAWVALAERFPEHAELSVRAGCVLRDAGNEGEALRYFERGFASEPTLWLAFGDDELVDLARENGDSATFEVARLAALASSASVQGDDDDAQDELFERIRETYSELLERYAERDDVIRELRKVGQEIRSKTESGDLPRAFVLRSAPRKS